MCAVCGCGQANTVTMTDVQTGEAHILSGPRADNEHTHEDGTTHSHPREHDGHESSRAGTCHKAHTHVHFAAAGTQIAGVMHNSPIDAARIHTAATTHAPLGGMTHAPLYPDTPANAAPPPAGRVTLETAVLAKNDRIAAGNRGWFEGRGVLALNLVSSPGSGKTALLERTIRDLGASIDIAVIEGDQMTTADADRVRAAGARAIQINTGAGCHLEADMIARALPPLNLGPGSLLLIENVGNLVCPAMFDLGERMKVAIMSVTEGEDKPLKYPFMFRAARVVLLNKMDLATHVGFDHDACLANLRAVNPSVQVIEVSARTGQGMGDWYDLLSSTLGAGLRPHADRSVIIRS